MSFECISHFTVSDCVRALYLDFVKSFAFKAGVKLLRWGIRSLSSKLDYTFVRLTKNFTQTQSIPSHRGIEQSVSINSENIWS